MRIVASIVCFALITALSPAQAIYDSLNVNQVFDAGNTAYADGNYEKAAEYYHAVITQSEDAHVLFNLGNAYYRLNHVPEAILYYEKALKLNPTDQDIQFNLSRANLLCKDEIESKEQSIITLGIQKVSRSISVNLWAIFSIFFSVLIAIGLIRYISAKNRKVKKSGFFLSMLGIILLIFSLIGGFTSKNAIENADTAIVFTPKVDIKNEPTRNASQAFVLHQGTKVWILESNADWFKIQIADGNLGWIKKEDVEII